MRAVPERQMAVVCPGDVEPVGVREPRRVAVGGAEKEKQCVAGFHRAAGEFAVLDREARRHLHRGLEAQDLLGGRGDQRTVEAQPFELVRMADKGEHAVREHVGRRLVAGGHEKGGIRIDLVLGEAALVVRRGDHRRQQIVAGVGASRSHQRVKVLAHLGEVSLRCNCELLCRRTRSHKEHDVLRPRLESVEVGLRDAEHGAHHHGGQRRGVGAVQVGLAVGRHGIEQPGGDALDHVRNPRHHAHAEGGRQQPADARVIRRIAERDDASQGALHQRTPVAHAGAEGFEDPADARGA